jgi:uncharacterized repeat protein (TIGR01451 family)
MFLIHAKLKMLYPSIPKGIIRMSKLRWLLPCSVIFALLMAMGCQSTMNDPKRDMQQQFSEDNLVGISKTGPHMTNLNTPYTYCIDIKAFSKAGKVVVTDELPSSVKYVSSMPKAMVEGSVLTWDVGDLEAWEERSFKVTVTPMEEGEHQSCAYISALPKACLISTVRQAALKIVKTGPEMAVIGDTVPYTIVVTNVGTTVAENVDLKDFAPEGMTLAKHSKLNYNLGDINPGDSKTTRVTLVAQQKGRFINKATAKASNTAAVSDTAITVVNERLLTITKTGTETQFIGKTASYTITVKNTGSVTLNNVTVTDDAPIGTKVVEAPGAKINGQRSTWMIDALPPGVHKTFTLVLTSRTHGNLTNNAYASTDNMKKQASFTTLWKGYAALLVEVIDTKDPCLVGEDTTYIIRVINQGTAPAEAVNITANLPEQFSFTSATGSTFEQMGQKVTFKNIPFLAPGQSIQYQINAKANAAGDARIFVKLNSELLKNAVTEEESTQVY